MSDVTSTGGGESIRVLIADDSAVMLESLALAVEQAGAIEVVATVADAESVLPQVRASDPDVVLLDLRLGNGWGFDLVPDIRRQPSGPEVVVLSAVVDESTQDEADRAGVFRQLAKGCPLEEIRSAVTAAAAQTEPGKV